MKHQGSTAGAGTEKKNKSSQLLSHEENQQVFNLLDRKCMSMCTAVVQLYVTDAPAHSHWVKRYTGALCFVKDSGKKSYYCRLFCLMRHEMVWEQEMYDTIQIQRTRPYLLNFEGQDGIVALNFASEEEAESFHRVSTLTVANRIKRREA
uniref:Uncharacterized protein n=1 Tax=Phlebotomus papatasi TaxID=29031 RepID=A0A1B0GNA0_PHLPP